MIKNAKVNFNFTSSLSRKILKITISKNIKYKPSLSTKVDKNIDKNIATTIKMDSSSNNI